MKKFNVFYKKSGCYLNKGNLADNQYEVNFDAN